MNHTAAVLTLAALAHTHRLAIFRLLVVHGTSGITAGEIARTVGIGATAASFHLKELDRAGLIQATRIGRNIRYALHVERVRQLLTFLTEDCCRGQPELMGGILERPVSLLTGCDGATHDPSGPAVNERDPDHCCEPTTNGHPKADHAPKPKRNKPRPQRSSKP
ncbi:MAG: winged helix-turn-helix domain-containing protein [Hyphomicrobiaceae bacterium]|nr:winged helix-turn-helix domain-containing protein [Hyphomicrobiaceae bacterium]